jgi:hypothetical protein
MLEQGRNSAWGLECIDFEYAAVLRCLFRAIDTLDRDYAQRAQKWADYEQTFQLCPSLQRFLDSALLGDGEFSFEAMTGGFRFMCREEEDPYGQIAILSAYSRTPVPGCFFTFDWHSEVAERTDELRAIADDFYFCMRQLAPAAAEALARDRLRYNMPPT